MDILDGVSLIFRLLSVVIGPLLAVVVYIIYRKTRGGSVGWLYISIAFISLGVWSLSQLLFLVVFPNFLARTIIGAMTIFLITFFIPMAAVKLANDMKCKLPGWMTEVNVIIIGFVYYFIMYLYNIMASQDFLGSVASISLIGLTPMFIIASVGYLAIARETRVKLWSWWVIGMVFCFVGAFLIAAMFTNCCGTGAPLEWEPSCVRWMYDYAPATPLPCVEAVLPITSDGAVILSIGLVFLLYSMEKMRRLMTFKTSG